MRLLYIEDDEIDVLAMKRLLRAFKGVKMDVCKVMKDLARVELSNYDAIISDSNLPDATYKELRQVLPESKTTYISGSQIEDFDVWVKPISKEQLSTLIDQEDLVNLSYIKALAEGDLEYEQEMIAIALRVLPQRYAELIEAQNNEKSLHVAAHKTKSSYRVCGINNSLLSEIENLKGENFRDKAKKAKLLESVKTQIDKAISELKTMGN